MNDVRRSEVERRDVLVTLFWDTDDGPPSVRFSAEPEDINTVRLWLEEYVELLNRMEPALQSMRRPE